MTKKDKEKEESSEDHGGKGLGGWANTGIGPGGCFSLLAVFSAAAVLVILAARLFQ